jgi:hypothetical protein
LIAREKEGRAYLAAEKLIQLSAISEKLPSGAKAHVHCATVAARLKPCPGYKTLSPQFFTEL